MNNSKVTATGLRLSTTSFFRNYSFALFAGFALVLCGCKKEAKVAPPTEADVKPVNPADTAKAQEQTRIDQINAMRAGIEPAAPALKLRGGELATPEVLAAYNQEITRARFKMGESPETLQELVQKWVVTHRVLPPLPTAPAGKRIVYDPLRIIIRLDPP